MDRFVGKIAVVTGAGHGIGKAITMELLRRGVNVVGFGRHLAALQDLGEEVSTSEFRGQFHPMQCDVSKEPQIQKAFKEINVHLGPVWILINGAGAAVEVMLSDATANDFDGNFGPFVEGILLCSKEALKSMNDHSVQGGHIVNIISVTDRETTIVEQDYIMSNLSKDVARVISEGLRREVIRNKMNVKVSEINPAVTRTRAVEKFIDGWTEMELLEPQNLADCCISILNTPPNVLIPELVIRPTHDLYIL